MPLSGQGRSGPAIAKRGGLLGPLRAVQGDQSIRAVIPPMKDGGGGGSIVNVSSIEGFASAAGMAAYSASKFALRGGTKVAAQELGQFGIRVNSVHPGRRRHAYDDRGGSAVPRCRWRTVSSRLPIGRFAESIELSRLVAFLASDDAS